MEEIKRAKHANYRDMVNYEALEVGIAALFFVFIESSIFKEFNKRRTPVFDPLIILQISNLFSVVTHGKYLR